VHTRRMLWRLSHSVYYNSFDSGELKPAIKEQFIYEPHDPPPKKCSMSAQRLSLIYLVKELSGC